MQRWITDLRASHEATPIAASPEVRRWAEERIGAAACDWAAETARSIAVRRAGDPGTALPPAGARGCEECILTTLVGLSDVSGDTPVRTPRGALEDARTAARTGAPLQSLMRIAWASHAALQTRLIEIIGSSSDRTRAIDDVLRLTTALTTFADRYLADISTTYDRERSAHGDRHLAEQRRVIDDVLAGGEPPTDALALLGIRFDRSHRTAVCWTPTDRPASHRFAADMAAELRAAVLVVDRPDAVEIHWSTDRPIEVSVARVDRLRPDHLRVAVGAAGQGIDGFRASVVTARRTWTAVSLSPTIRSARYQDVALLSLLITDSNHARDFVRHELAGLLGTDERSRGLRATLRSWLLSGRSRQTVADGAHIAPTTVTYRVKRAEELLGRRASDRPQETLTALELARAFPQLLGDTSVDGIRVDTSRVVAPSEIPVLLNRP